MNAVATPVRTSNSAGTAAWVCLAIAWVCFLVPIPGIGVFIGWPLNLVVFILAIVAMSQNGAMAGLFQLLSSLIVSPIVYFLGLALMVALVGQTSYEDYTVQTEQATLHIDATGAATTRATSDIADDMGNPDTDSTIAADAAAAAPGPASLPAADKADKAAEADAPAAH